MLPPDAEEAEEPPLIAIEPPVEELLEPEARLNLPATMPEEPTEMLTSPTALEDESEESLTEPL